MKVKRLFHSGNSLAKKSLVARKVGFYKDCYDLTLVELLVTLTIMVIIVSIAVPSIAGQLAAMEARRIRFTITNMLTMAKSESLIQRRDMIVCFIDDQGQCLRDNGQTLALFIDRNDNNRFDSSVDSLLQQQQLNAKYGSMHLRAANRSYVKFYGDSGKPRGHFGHIKYCPKSSFAQAAYQVSFNESGIIKFKPNSLHPTGCSS